MSDWQSRKEDAAFEAREWTRKTGAVGWVFGIGSGLIVGALAYFQAPFWATMGTATALIVLSIFAMLLEIGHRLHFQTMIAALTASRVETEVKEIRDRLEQTEWTVNDIAKWTRPPSTNY